VTPTARQRTPSLEVRDALLRAARELLDQAGAQALSVREIATRAGVAPMGVYKRFGSKNGILDALLVEGFTELGTAVASTHRAPLWDTPTGTDGLAPLASIAASMHRYRAFALANPSMYALMFDRPVPELVPSPASLAAAHAAFEHLVNAVRLGVATGDIHPGEPIEIAQRLWAGIHGAISLELRGMSFVTNPTAHYTNLVNTLLLGISRG